MKNWIWKSTHCVNHECPISFAELPKETDKCPTCKSWTNIVFIQTEEE